MICHSCGKQSGYEQFVAQRFAGGRVRLACPKCGARYQPPDPGEMYDRQIKDRKVKDKGENDNVRSAV
jgi:hypothetical protein